MIFNLDRLILRLLTLIEASGDALGNLIKQTLIEESDTVPLPLTDWGNDSVES